MSKKPTSPNPHDFQKFVTLKKYEKFGYKNSASVNIMLPVFLALLCSNGRALRL